MDRFDSIIIGFGKGGKTLAAELASKGEKVAMVEKSDKMYGGTCINVGCIPTKSLVNSAKISQILNLKSFEEKASYYKMAIEEKNRVVSMLRQKNFDKLNDNPNITIYNGEASFISTYSINIKLKDSQITLEADKIFINTGSVPVIPNIKGIENNKHVYVSETMLDLELLPEKLAIIGGGYIGLEFASMYSNFGSKVTVFQDGNKFIPREDDDIAQEILNVLKEKGIEFKFGVHTKSIVDNGKVAAITYTTSDNVEHIFNSDAVLIATGRKANTESLNLNLAGIETTARGAVKVNQYLQTNIKNIWAMGDVAGGLQFTYISLDDYRIVSSQLSGNTPQHSTSDRVVPYNVFIDPAFSRVGLNEREAIEKGYNIKITKLPVTAIPKAHVLKDTKGILKAVIDSDTDQILGAMLFCAESYEMINIVKMAMDANLKYTFLKHQIFTHPIMSESLNDLFSI